jgi:hypothetical protein
MEEENDKEGDWGKKLRKKEIEKEWRSEERIEKKKREKQSRSCILLSDEVGFTITFCFFIYLLSYW